MKDPCYTSSHDVTVSGHTSNEENPFADYMWMENEEEFNRQVVEELWEEDFIERCFVEMLREEEEHEWFIPARDLPLIGQKQDHLSLLTIGEAGSPDLAVNSNLNPNAKEFVPGVKY